MHIVFITHLDVFEIDFGDGTPKGRGMAICRSFHIPVRRLILIHVLILTLILIPIEILIEVPRDADSAFPEGQPGEVDFACILYS
jgi:hypothetical protein